MYCEKCGAKNDDNSLFCTECGQAFRKETSAQKTRAAYAPPTKPTAAKRKGSVKRTVIIAAVIALAVIIGVLYYMGKTATAPIKTAQGYFDCLAGGNMKGAFSMLDISESEFVTEKAFSAIMNAQLGDIGGNVINSACREIPSDDMLEKNYRVTYTLRGGSGKKTMEITLVRQPGKSWLLFDNYKVSAAAITAENVRIEAIKGSTLYIDGKKADKKYLKKNSDSSGDVYAIPSIFAGNHKLKCTAPFMKDSEFEGDIASGGTYEFTKATISDSAKDEIRQSLLDAMQQIYNSAIKKKSFSGLEKYASEEGEEELHDYYDEVCDSVRSDYYESELKSVTFSDLSFTGALDVDDDEIEYDMNASVRFTYSYVYEDYDGEIFEDSVDTPQKASGEIKVVYENGKWLIDDIELYLGLYF